MTAIHLMRFSWLLAVLLALATCSHDSKRDNALDPALTPPVELQVAVDDTAGTATLTWTTYAGEQPFAAYVLKRNQAEQVAVDVLDTLSSVDQTTFLDTTLLPDVAYVYRVVTINAGGLEVESEPRIVLLQSLSPVRITNLDFDSRTASASLAWSQYEGEDFVSYHVTRSVPGETPRQIAEFANPAQTALVDSALLGNTEYTYTIDVLTTHGTELSSETRAGSIHSLQTSWPLGFVDGSFVRLYAEREQELTALITTPSGATTSNEIHLLAYDPTGIRIFSVSESRLLQRLDFESYTQTAVVPHTTATSLTNSGLRLLSYALFALQGGEINAIVVALDPDGTALRFERSLFADEFAEPIESARAQVRGQFSMWAQDRQWSPGSGLHNRPLVWKISSGGVTLGEGGVPNSTVDIDGTVWTFFRCWACDQYRNLAEPERIVSVRNPETELTDFRIDYEIRLGPAAIHGIEIGAEEDGTSRFRLLVDPLEDEVVLEWFYRSDGQEELVRRLVSSYPVLGNRIYRLSLEMVDGRFQAFISTQFLWGVTLDEIPTWMSMIAAEDGIGLAIDDARFDVGEAGEQLFVNERQSPVGEIRVWETEDGQDEQIGILLPEDNTVLVRSGVTRNASGLLGWPPTNAAIGAGWGVEDGQMRVPLSFDVGPQGRMYVLDADNVRIQVFDAEGNYLTQWGSEGSGPGQFIFRLGGDSRSGNVAVDDEGFIYVADVGNMRIQKFAP